MQKWLLAILFVLSLLLAPAAVAQEQLTLSSSQIQIWPEYDQPGVLVIYQITLSDTTSLPVSLSIRIPIAAGDPNAVAARQVDGALYNIDHTRQVSGEWALINFTTSSAEVQVEYYDPGLTKEGAARHYSYTWPGDYSVSEMLIQVQQPVNTTDMRISPSLGPGVSGDDNLTYFTQNLGAVSAGQNIRITIDYQKSNDTLSAESLPVQPSAPIPQSAVPDTNLSTWLPWILGILGAGLIVGAIVWFWQTSRQRPVAKGRRRHTSVGGRETQVSSNTGEAAVYCAQCGKRAAPGDQFCRSCGTPIRNR